MRAFFLSFLCLLMGCASSVEEDRFKLSEKLKRSTVEIFVYTSSGTSGGTGFVIEDGYIATCFHVVDKKGAITDLVFYDGSVVRGVSIEGNEKFDIGIIHYDSNRLVSRPIPLKISKSALPIGRDVFWLGHPQLESFLFANGMIAETQNANGDYPREHVAFTGTVAPGMSGSALVDRDARVVGIVKSHMYGRHTGAYAIGFAVPPNILEFFLNTRKIPHRN